MSEPPPDAAYPMLLRGRSNRALVVGAGKVGLRKIAALLEGGIAVTVLSPEPLDRAQLPPGDLVHVRGLWPDDAPELRKFHLIFASTSARHINAEIAEAARELGSLVNVADAPKECDFFTVATIRHGDVIVSISTGGRSPAKARRLREDLEAWLMDRGAAE